MLVKPITCSASGPQTTWIRYSASVSPRVTEEEIVPGAMVQASETMLQEPAPVRSVAGPEGVNNMAVVVRWVVGALTAVFMVEGIWILCTTPGMEWFGVALMFLSALYGYLAALERPC